MRITTLTKEMQDSMAFSEVQIESLEPKHVIEFLCSFDSTKIDRCTMNTNMHISDTDLRSENNLLKVTEYCISDIDSFVKKFRDIPLIMTQDGVVHSLQNAEHTYVEETGLYSDLFPTKQSLFLHRLLSPLIKRKIKDYESKSQNRLKQFTLQGFVKLLKETGELKTTSSEAMSWDKVCPSVKWIQQFWAFFCSLTDICPSDKIVAANLQIVNMIPLIPVHVLKNDGKETYLFPPVSRKMIIDADSFSMNESLHDAIKTMKLPEIDQDIIREDPLKLMLIQQIPNFKTPIDIIECLFHKFGKVATSGISPPLATHIVHYFNDYIPSDTCVDIDKLKQLPFYVTHFEKCVAIMSYTKVCVVPEDLPANGLEELAAKANVLMLQDSGADKIFEKLNIPKFGIFKIYTDYIIPYQSKMMRESLYTHLGFLAQRIKLDCAESSELLSMLRSTPFIETAHKRRVRACSLFDPTHEVFEKFCVESELLPEQLIQYVSLDFLGTIGMKRKLSKELFERFAREVEKMGCHSGLTSHVIELSSLLLKHLFSMSSTFFDVETLSDFSKIKFIPPSKPDEKLSQIHAYYNCHKLSSFGNSSLDSSVKTCWTISDILPRFADPTIQKGNDENIIIKKLHICRKPSLSSLIQHCENVWRSVNENLKKQGNTICLETLESVFHEIYHDLKTYMVSGKLDNNKVKQLKEIPFIYIPKLKQTVLTKSVVITCKEEEEIPPFLNKCPDEYIRYKDLFLFLSAREDISCDAYAFMLYTLRESCNTSNIVLPKERSDAVKAMELFFKYLTQLSEETTIDEKHKFLLSENHTLEYCRNLIVKNNSYFLKRVLKCPTVQCNFLLGFKTFDKYNLKVENCVDSLQFLPSRSRPYLLTDIVRERVMLENIVYRDIRDSRRIEDFFHCQYFVRGFCRLIKHIWKNEGQKWTTDEEKRLVNHLGNISFLHATGIETLLEIDVIENGEIHSKQLLENTNEKKSVHIETTKNKICVFFDTSDSDWFEDVKTELAVYLNGAVYKCLKDQHLMRLRGILGMRDTPERINEYLSKAKIEEYVSGISIEEAPAVPKPGTFVPRDLHAFLDNGYIILEFDYKFMALELEDPALSDDTDLNTNDGFPADFDPTYIYVQIIRKVESCATHPLLQEYEIDDGTQSVRKVRACKLFKIRNGEEKSIMAYAGEMSDKDKNSATQTLSFKTVFKDVRQCLREAWKENMVDRRGIVKRLLLKWHPDKNPDNVSFCTTIFQYIQQCLRCLEAGKDLPDDDFDDKDNNSESSNFSRSTGEYWSNSWYGCSWERREKKRSSHDWNNRRGSNEEFDGGLNARRSYFTTPGPQPYHYKTEARRWQKQAVSDSNNSSLSLQRVPNNSLNWICYMAHQAAEKSLKAAWYAKDANKMHSVRLSHSLSSFANGLGSDVETLAISLTNLTGEHTRMRYPDACYGQHIPAESFNRQTAETVVSVAKQIIDIVQRKYIE